MTTLQPQFRKSIGVVNPADGSVSDPPLILQGASWTMNPDGKTWTTTLHDGTPDRLQYASSAEWPTFNMQSHWSAKQANIYGNISDILNFNPSGLILDPAHIHAQITFPVFAKLHGPIRVSCVFVARCLNGQLSTYGAGTYHPDSTSDAQPWSDVWWDTPDGTMPTMTGDPTADMGVQTWKVWFNFTPPTIAFGKPARGFGSFEVQQHVQFTNGDLMDVDNIVPYWNEMNPGAPITQAAEGPQDVPFIGVIAAPIPSAASFPDGKIDDSFGQNEVFIRNFTPTAPLKGRWNPPPSPWDTFAGFSQISLMTNSYGQTIPSTAGSARCIRGANYHMETLSGPNPDGTANRLTDGIPGTLTSNIVQSGIIPCPCVIDNTGLAEGVYTYSFDRIQPENTLPTNAVVSRIGISTTTSGSIEPPPMDIMVPDVIGQTQSQAANTLMAAGLVLGMVTNEVSMQPPGVVLSQSPGPGTMVTPGSAVAIIVSVEAPPPVDDDGVLIGTIHKRQDGTTCVCGIKGISSITTDSEGNPCLVLDRAM